jgi:hypothetical protein
MSDVDRRIRFKELKGIIRVARSTIDRWEKDDRYRGDDPFPARVRTGQCTHRFDVERGAGVPVGSPQLSSSRASFNPKKRTPSLGCRSAPCHG